MDVQCLRESTGLTWWRNGVSQVCILLYLLPTSRSAAPRHDERHRRSASVGATLKELSRTFGKISHRHGKAENARFVTLEG
ncbi:hypothetical protein ACKKBG_A11760 [Auxenochlorella protothecoides x Auxenochlorella symbiontica]